MKHTRDEIQNIDWHDLYYYVDGEIYHKRKRPGVEAGRIAGWVHVKGYYYINFKGVTYRRSRVVWVMCHGYIDKNLEINHINHNRGDDRIENLELVDRGQNTRFTRKYRARGGGECASRYKGVKVNRNGTYQAQLQFNRQKICLGTFKSELAAAEIYDDAAFRLFGGFSVLNFPDRVPKYWADKSKWRLTDSTEPSQ